MEIINPVIRKELGALTPNEQNQRLIELTKNADNIRPQTIAQAMERPLPTPPKPSLEALLSLNKGALLAEYRSMRKDNASQTKAVGWMYTHLKDLGGVLRGKDDIREKQIEEIIKIVDNLKGNGAAPQEKAQALLNGLNTVKLEIESESNMFSSSMAKLLTQKMDDLKKDYPNLKEPEKQTSFKMKP